MISALQLAHISNDRETRENSGALRTVALIHTDSKGDLPKWVKAGIEENEAWLKEMKERPGENIGSPHVRVCLITLHALITSEEIQQQKFEQSLKGLKEWWKVMTKEVASEIKIFKIRGPPKRGSNFEDDEEMEQISTASTTSGEMVSPLWGRALGSDHFHEIIPIRMSPARPGCNGHRQMVYGRNAQDALLRGQALLGDPGRPSNLPQ